MLITYARSSSLNNIKFCEMQYFMTYVLGHRSDSGKKAESGTIVHKVMEVLACLKKFQQDNPKRKYLQINDDVVGDVKIHVDSFHSKDFIESLASTAYKEYTKKSKHKWTNSDRKEVSRLTWLGLEFNNGQFDPRLSNVLHPEPHFDIPITEDWAKFEYEYKGEKFSGNLAIKGTIDLVTQVNDDTIEVIDYKTGRRVDWATGEEKTYDTLHDDIQLLLYYYAISHLYPDFEQTIMTIFYIKDGGPFSLCFEKSDEKKFLGMLKEKFEYIKNNNNPQPLSDNRSHWKCTKLCHFCKNKWEGSDKNMCQYVGDYLDEHGMNKTVCDLSAPGFSINYYESPG